jgi:hypothetical protein
MKRAVVALLVLASFTLSGCFPHNAKHRTYAKIAEGGSLVAGIGISAFANTGADCDSMAMAGVETSCRTTAKWLSTAGVTLILVGLIGFVATISTAEEAEDAKKAAEIKVETKPAEKPDVKLPPGVDPAKKSNDTSVDDNQPSGSASPTSAAPQR